MRVVGIKIVIQELTRKTYQYLTALKINLLNGNLNEVAICKHCKNVLILTEKATERTINIIFKSNYCRYCETLMEKKVKVEKLASQNIYHSVLGTKQTVLIIMMEVLGTPSSVICYFQQLFRNNTCIQAKTCPKSVKYIGTNSKACISNFNLQSMNRCFLTEMYY